jgi:hypothetical protein
MKKITVILMGLIMMFGLSSCVTAVHAQDDAYFDGEVDATIVISYGKPYIINDMIEYYFYRGWYYYPSWVNDSYYFHRYRRPLPRGTFYDWYRPIPKSHFHPAPRQRYHRPGHGYYHKYTPPRHNNIGTHVRRPHGHTNMIPNTGGHSRPKMGGRK